MQPQGQQTSAVSAEGHEQGLAQGYLPGQSGEQVEAKDGQEEDAHHNEQAGPSRDGKGKSRGNDCGDDGGGGAQVAGA